MKVKYGIGPGWNDLVEPIVKQAEREELSSIWLRERRGSLRVYTPDASRLLNDMIATAESKSMETCEECGASGERVDLGGWFKTLCPSCHQKLEQDLTSYE